MYVLEGTVCILYLLLWVGGWVMALNNGDEHGTGGLHGAERASHGMNFNMKGKYI